MIPKPIEEPIYQATSFSQIDPELESNTTAHGDGLILRQNEQNIFERIEKIKNT